MGARRPAHHDHPVGIDAVALGIRLDPGNGAMHVADHADHVGLGAAAVRGVHDDVALRRELAEQWAGEDVFVEEVPRAAVQVDDRRAGTLDARRRLPDVGEELAIGAGNGPEGHVTRPAWLRHPAQAQRPATLEHPPLDLGRDPLLPLLAECPLETIVGARHPGDVVGPDTRAEHPGHHRES